MLPNEKEIPSFISLIFFSVYFSSFVFEDAFLSEPESPTIVVDFIMLCSGYVDCKFCCSVAKIRLYFL